MLDLGFDFTLTTTLPTYYFMEAGRILKTLESETKDFTTHDTTSSSHISIFVLVFLALKCHRDNKDEPRDCLYMQHLASPLSGTDLGDPLILQQAVSRPALWASNGMLEASGEEMLSHFLRLPVNN